MKTRTLILIAFVIATSVPAAAQQARWSAEQKEVIDNILACWDAWKQAAEKNDPQIWLSRCACADDAVAWYTADGAPRDIKWHYDRQLAVTRQGSPDWVDIRPFSVNIYGDIAAVHFYAYWKSMTPSGYEVEEQKRLEVFKKINGRWTLIAGQTTPVVR